MECEAKLEVSRRVYANQVVPFGPFALVMLVAAAGGRVSNKVRAKQFVNILY
jgi:hypothetical protein